ncbi:MAG: hypothetical protein GY696_17155 [Gammaproteobacteria bacterium]|nr:hypothetical protein [Gammaproteobacteria bacterium]
MSLRSRHIGTPLSPMPEGSDELIASLARAVKASNAKSAGNSTAVGAPPAAAKQSLCAESPSGMARPFMEWSPGSSNHESRLMNLKFPFSLPIFAGTGRQDFRVWIDLFDRAILACGDLSGGERLRYLGVFLEGPAYRVLRGCGVEATYDSVVAALKAKFLSSEECRWSVVKFLGRVQEGIEFIFVY